jgi:hypothetical protein
MARPKGHHCLGNKSLSSDACPAEAETDEKMIVHQATDCIMLPSEGVSRGYCPCEGSQIGHVDTRMKSMWVSRITTAYKGYSPTDLLSLFIRVMVWYLHGQPSLLPWLILCCLQQGRAYEGGATQRLMQTGSPLCLGTSYALHHFWCRLQACSGTKP